MMESITNLNLGEPPEQALATAQKASPKRLLNIVRSEWGSENGLHYRRAVTFQEDQSFPH